MSNPIEDGGSAFPQVEQQAEGDWRGPIYSAGGMSLRDWFAGQALQGMMTQPEAAQSWTDVQMSEWSYQTADAMLAEREKGGSDE